MGVVRLIYLSPELRMLTNRSEEQIAINERMTIVDVLRILGEKYGPSFAYLLFDSNGSLRAGVELFIDGALVPNKDLKLEVGSNKEVSLILATPIGGG